MKLRDPSIHLNHWATHEADPRASLFKTFIDEKFGDPKAYRLFVRHKSDGILVNTNRDHPKKQPNPKQPWQRRSTKRN